MPTRGFPVVKHLPAKGGKARGMGLIPGSGRFPGVRNSNTLQYAGLENSMDYIAHGVAEKLDTTEQLSHFEDIVMWTPLPLIH